MSIYDKTILYTNSLLLPLYGYSNVILMKNRNNNTKNLKFILFNLLYLLLNIILKSKYDKYIYII